MKTSNEQLVTSVHFVLAAYNIIIIVLIIYVYGT